MMTKKIRNVQKRADKLAMIQAKRAKGDRLEQDQLEALKSQPTVLAQLDTYNEVTQLFEAYSAFQSIGYTAFLTCFSFWHVVAGKLLDKD